MAVLLIIGVQVLSNDQILIGGRYLMPVLELVLFLCVTFVHHSHWKAHLRDQKHPRGFLDNNVTVLTVLLVFLLLTVNSLSLRSLLLHLLNASDATGKTLLSDAFLIWINNLVIFALLYWELDRGGPWLRVTGKERLPDFQFTQMSDAQSRWKPNFTDYVFLAFTNATAFSPTDTLPLTPRAKWLMMVQAMLSFVTVAIVAARAVNILG
ncbi:hypothetical protein GCM10008938_13270 [Deinococcus roseus]|uniref:DUF1345 domain-containing protein n=2 Tax=Deinococcus roseus TaxID=392414 RepID=A0ABQ2CWP9_9DEIO|nr:hypothetical protein GCM10008938_13270 [Deinococcus roseus]